VELITIGTGTVAPSAHRTSAAHFVRRNGVQLLLDCGPGTLHRLATFAIPWPSITHVALTHFHPDHFADLPMLVYALKYTTRPPREDPLVILGPRGVVRLLRSLAEGYGSWLLDPGFPIVILDVQPGEPFPLDGELTLEAFPVPHTEESVALGLTAPGPAGVYGRHGAVGRAGPMGQGLQPVARGMLASRIHGDRHPFNARASRRAGPGGGSETARSDALLSPRRNTGSGAQRGDPFHGSRDRGDRRGTVHHLMRG